MRRRRKPSARGLLPLAEWPLADFVEDMQAVYHGDPDQRYVRAAIVLRYAPERLPREQAAEFGTDPLYGTYKLDFDDDDRVEVFMDHNLGSLVREIENFANLEDAAAAAIKWIGPDSVGAAFCYLPGLYQAAFFEAVTGVSRAWNELQIQWAVPGDQAEADVVPVRFYPPPVDQPDKGWVLMPLALIHDLYDRSLDSARISDLIVGYELPWLRGDADEMR
jgi:hypothetical protein